MMYTHMPFSKKTTPPTPLTYSKHSLTLTSVFCKKLVGREKICIGMQKFLVHLNKRKMLIRCALYIVIDVCIVLFTDVIT